MDKIRIFAIACRKSDENWICIGMLVETSSTENAGKYSFFLHWDWEAIETMLFFHFAACHHNRQPFALILHSERRYINEEFIATSNSIFIVCGDVGLFGVCVLDFYFVRRCWFTVMSLNCLSFWWF